MINASYLDERKNPSRASVTEADLHYEGSISIDRSLLDAAGFLINERVEIYNIETGARFATYVIEAPQRSGIIGLNGAAARLALPETKLSSLHMPPLMRRKQERTDRALCWLTGRTASCQAERCEAGAEAFGFSGHKNCCVHDAPWEWRMSPIQAAKIGDYVTALDALKDDKRLRGLKPRAGIDFASNDYLASASAPRMKNAISAAARRWVRQAHSSPAHECCATSWSIAADR